MFTRTLTAVVFGGLALTGVAAPATAETTPPPSACQNSVAAAAQAKHSLTHAQADAAHARNALRQAKATKNSHAIAAAQRRIARAQARVATAKTTELKANAKRRHNCTNTTPGQPS